MRQHLRVILTLFTFSTFALHAVYKPAVAAPAQKPTAALAPGPYSSQQLEKMLEGIALYPDTLLQPMLAASTFPDQIVDAALYLQGDGDPKGIAKQPWDDTVKSTANYPSVLQMMAEDIDWTIRLGDAFMNQNKELVAAVQRLRARAKALGNLKSNKNQEVIVETIPSGQTIIQIEPTAPQTVYVPASTTTIVYTEPQPSSNDALVPVATFGLGLALGYAMADDHDDHYYHSHWYGGPGFWHSGGAYHDWVDHRNDQWDDAMDFRRDQWNDVNDFRNDRWDDMYDLKKDKQNFRQDMVKEGYSPEKQAERQSRRNDARANMSPEQQAKAQERKTQARSKAQSMSPEQRQQAAREKAKNLPSASERRQNFENRSGSGFSASQRESAQARASSARARTSRPARQSTTRTRPASRSYSSRNAMSGYSGNRSVSRQRTRGASSRARASRGGRGRRR